MEEKEYMGFCYDLTLNRVGRRVLSYAVDVYKMMLEGDFGFLEGLVNSIRKERGVVNPLGRTGYDRYVKAALHDLPLLLYGRSGKPASVPQSTLGVINSVQSMPRSRNSLRRLPYRECLSLCAILDAHTRLCIGQLAVAIEHLPSDFSLSRREDLDSLVAYLVKALYGLDGGSSWSVFSNRECYSQGVSYDLLQIIRNRLAWDREPTGGMTVDFGAPVLAYRMTGKSRPVVSIARA